MSRTWICVSLLCFCLLVVGFLLTTNTEFAAAGVGKVAPLETNVALSQAIHPVGTVASSMDGVVQEFLAKEGSSEEMSATAKDAEVDLAETTSQCPVLPPVRQKGAARICKEQPSSSSKFPSKAKNVNDRLRQVLSLPYSDSWDEVSKAVDAGKVDLATGIRFTTDGQLFAPDYFHCINFEVYDKHYAQTPDSALALRNKWKSEEIFGKIHLMNLIKMLHFTVDHSDGGLWYTSQLIHSLQVYEGVRKDKEAIISKYGDEYYVDLLLAGLLHDMGKMLTLLGEEDANADCMNVLLCKPAPGVGFDSEDMVQTFNHDEYGYQKLLPYLSKRKRVLAAMRFHSLREAEGSIHKVLGEDLDSRPRHFSEAVSEDVVAFVKHFRHYDQHTKRVTGVIPSVDWELIRGLFEAEFPPNGVITW
jgi:hypothetical protein